jgi:DNA-binding transcriptional LysR family regulator
MRILFEKLCRSTDTQPAIAAEVIGLTTAWEMTCRGVGATLLPLQFVQRYAAQGLKILQLRDPVTLRQPAIVVKRGQYLSPYAKYAISLLTGET